MTKFNEADIKNYYKEMFSTRRFPIRYDAEGKELIRYDRDGREIKNISEYPIFRDEEDITSHFLGMINKGTTGLQTFNSAEGYQGYFFVLGQPQNITEKKYGESSQGPTYSIELHNLPIRALSNTTGQYENKDLMVEKVKLTARFDDNSKRWILTSIETDDPILKAVIESGKTVGEVIAKKHPAKTKPEGYTEYKPDDDYEKPSILDKFRGNKI